jgi:uncharacterized protein (TIGR02265 family)
VEKLVHLDALASTIDPFRAQLTPRIRDRLKTEAGFDDSATSATYPMAALDGTIRVISEEFFKGLKPDQATYELGRATLKRYGEGALGKALFGIVRLLGPMKFIKRMPALFRQTNNYADVKIEVKGPTSYEIDHNEVGAYPHYLRGVMQGCADLIGLKGHRAELLSYDGHRGRYLCHWEA